MTPILSKKNLVGIFAIFVILVIVFVFFVLKGQKIEVVTDSAQYADGEPLRLKIKNYLLGNICFSSCYPYYLEKENGVGWKGYLYEDCPHPDVAEKCIGAFGTKAFETSLPETIEGKHRVLIPVCSNCKEGLSFKETNRFYSNVFEIK